MMHYQCRELYVEGLIREGEMLDHSGLELDGDVAPGRFRAGTRDLLRSRIYACHAAHAAHSAHATRCFQRQRSRATADVQHRIPGLYACQGGCPLPELAHLAAEQPGIEKRFHQIVAPAPTPDQ